MPLLRRHCPQCGTKVNWVRLWLKPWLGARWPCPNCGTTLRFEVGRRLLVAGLLALLFALALWTGPLLTASLGALAWGILIPALLVLLFLIQMLDAITLA